jgi:NADH-quinone oxidoreductase subunit L
MVTALLTAIYMFRLYFMAFHGEPRDAHAFEHAHESPWTMTVPLAVLAILSIGLGGVMGFSEHWFDHRVNSNVLVAMEVPDEQAVAIPEGDRYAGGPATESDAQAGLREAVHHAHYPVLFLSIGCFVLGVLGAWLFFGPRAPLPAQRTLAPDAPLGRALRPLRYCLVNLWFVDLFYYKFVLGLLHLLRHACGIFDKVVVDGLVNLQALICLTVSWAVGRVDYDGVDGTVRGIGEVTLRSGKWLRRVQTGRIQDYLYATVFLTAGVVLVSLLIFWLSP